MLRGTRVGMIPPPDRLTAKACWRCGVKFSPSEQNVTPAAPCRDCREALRDEGDTTIWDRRQLAAARNERTP